MKTIKKVSAILISAMLTLSMCTSSLSVAAATTSEESENNVSSEMSTYATVNTDSTESTDPTVNTDTVVTTEPAESTEVTAATSNTAPSAAAEPVTYPYVNTNIYETSEPDTQPEFIPDNHHYSVAGDIGFTGADWDPTTNYMTQNEYYRELYKITFYDVPAGEYRFQVTDGTFENTWGASDGSCYILTMAEQADVTINFNSEEGIVSVSTRGYGDYNIEYISVVGNGTEGSAWMCGESWNPEANLLWDGGDDPWYIEFPNVPAGDNYQAKFLINGKDEFTWTTDGKFNSDEATPIVVEEDGSTVCISIDISDYDFANKTGKVKTYVNVIPPDEEIILYVARPIFSDEKEWNDMYFAYSSDSNVSKVNKIEMYESELVYTMTDPVTGVLTTNANLMVYELYIPEELVAEIDAASYTGFMNEKGTIRTNYIWSNAVTRANIDAEGYTNKKHSVAELDGKIFVINDSVNTANKTSYLGYWTSEHPEEVITTIYVYSPMVNETTGMGTVYFRYGKTASVTDCKRLRMEETDYYNRVKGVTSNVLQDGNWVLYELGLTRRQVNFIDSCDYTGFASPFGASIRTNYTYSNSVTRANIYEPGYGATRHWIQTLNGLVFYIKSSANENNTISYTGNWENKNASIKLVEFNVAVPSVVGGKPVDSMNLIFADDYDAENAGYFSMKKTNETIEVDKVYTSIIDENVEWVVYTFKCDVSLADSIANARYIGFATSDRKIRTCFNYTHNIFRAGVDEYVTPYDATVFTHPRDLDDATFIICGAVNPSNTITLNGYWQKK